MLRSPIAVLLSLTLLATALRAQGVPDIERPVPFDSAGRVTVVTPTLVARLALSAPAWPVTSGFREARLYARAGGGHVLVVTRVDGTVERHLLDGAAVASLSRAVGTALVARGRDDTPAGSTGLDISQPAGNAFVRNQAFLGLAAYGPATSALLSNSGAAAATGGYLLAAGSSFFVAARMVKNRPVTRAQSSLATHAGFRGGAAGAGIAAITGASGGPGYGAPILAGSLAGTVAGFTFARPLSDGEAATSGLVADLAALTTLGVGGVLGAFSEKDTLEFGYEDRRLKSKGKTAIGSAIATGMVGYLTGPRYARRAAYNVTAGDARVVFTAAAIGAAASLALPGDNVDERAIYGVATAGLLTGFVLGDRLLARSADRTPADGGYAQLGAVAGALMGGGLALTMEGGRRTTVSLVAGGGALGLFAADRLLDPAPDAGPRRGVMQSSALPADQRIHVSLAPLATALALHAADAGREPSSFTQARLARDGRAALTPLPVVRIAW